MRRAVLAVLVVAVGSWLGACFDFDEYSFETEVSGIQPAGAGPGGSGGMAGSSGAAGGGGTGGVNPACVEDPASCPPPRPPPSPGSRGASCQDGIECDSSFCVDGVCCDEACEDICMACNNPGQEGLCLGTENDDQCPVTSCPPSTACLEYGNSDATQGGNCAAARTCRGIGDCARFPKPVGTACGTELAPGTCNATGGCDNGLKPLGAPCEAGVECAEGFCALTAGGTRVCCDQDCTGTCQQCSPLGNCIEWPAADARCVPEQACPTGDICNDYPATPETVACVGFNQCAPVCQPVARRPATACTCDAAGACLLNLGQTCGGPDECTSGFCSGGVCCEGACDGTCEQCDESGSCVPIDDCDCDPGDTSTCGTAIGSRGDCASFPITCTADRQWPTQQCNPRSAEQCNSDGRDEDCNGESRNGCQCINDTIGNCGRDLGARGVCADRDLAFCTGGRWPSEQCQPTSNEICGNGLDDNCNGQTDESPPCNVFDPSACQFFVRPECDEERCSRCQGCFDCEDIVNCVADNPDCVTAADPICGDPGNACESVVLGIQFPELEPLEAARDYITCSCTR